MKDFDRELAKCIGSASSKFGVINRELISTCYAKTSLSLDAVEPDHVAQKWIDFLADKLSDLKIGGLDSGQIAELVFSKIAKS